MIWKNSGKNYACKGKNLIMVMDGSTLDLLQSTEQMAITSSFNRIWTTI